MERVPYRILFKCIVGSQAYGTAVPESDVDYKGVYIQEYDDLLSFKYNEQVEIGKDECYYEVRRFLQLAQSANPTILEMLWMPDDCIVSSSPEFVLVQGVRERFLTKKCRDSFGGYAVAQIQKAGGLRKKMNWEKSRIERKGVLDFCYVLVDKASMPVRRWLSMSDQKSYGLSSIPHFRYTYNIFLGELFRGIVTSEDANDICLSEIPDGAVKCGTLYFNKDEYSVHCREYKQYQEWLEKRNQQRYIDTGHGQRIDGKNLLHCRRLLDMAIEIAREGRLVVRRNDAKELLKIRRGEVDLEKIIEKAEADIKMLDDVYAKSGLPDAVDMGFVNDLLLQVRHYKK